MTDSVESRALSNVRKINELDKAKDWRRCLITDRGGARYERTQKFAELVLQVRPGKPAVLNRQFNVYVYSSVTTNVLRRPLQSASVYKLPAGTTIAREIVNGESRVVACTSDGRRLTMMTIKPKARANIGNSRVKLMIHHRFVQPSGRGAGTRSGRRSGPAMDKGSFHG
jgi:hypothetical protein